MKRQIAIRKSLGDITTAIKLLNEFLKLFMADKEAWAELADLYISQNMLGEKKKKTFSQKAKSHKISPPTKKKSLRYTLGLKMPPFATKN